MASVFLTVFTTGHVHNKMSALLLQMVGGKRPHDVRLQHVHMVPLENAQHHALIDFLDGGEDWWIMMDADNPPCENPLPMLDSMDPEKPHVHGLVTPVWNAGKVVPNAYDLRTTEYYTLGWNNPAAAVKVDAVGGGCMIIPRSVFDLPKFPKQPFSRQTNKRGRVTRGNDLSFCARVNKCGGEVWARFDRRCHHYVEVDLLELVP